MQGDEEAGNQRDEDSFSYNFRTLRNFNPTATTLPSASPSKQDTKNYENVHMKMRKITKKTKLRLRKLSKITNKT